MHQHSAWRHAHQSKTQNLCLQALAHACLHVLSLMRSQVRKQALRTFMGVGSICPALPSPALCNGRARTPECTSSPQRSSRGRASCHLPGLAAGTAAHRPRALRRAGPPAASCRPCARHNHVGREARTSQSHAGCQSRELKRTATRQTDQVKVGIDSRRY
jgi:hypothetical protein